MDYDPNALSITEIQAWLAHLGYNPKGVDGKWGPNTEAAAKALLKDNRTGMVASVRIGAEQTILNTIAGLFVGPIDGIPGAITKAARKHWVSSNRWRNVLEKSQQADDRFPEPVKTVWPKESELKKFFGEPGSRLGSVRLAYPMELSWDRGITVSKFAAHELVVPTLEEVFSETLKHYGKDGVRELGLNVFGGCFNIRAKRGGTSLSTHAWGIAVDIDPERNALRWGKDKAEMAKPEYDFWWKLWTERGYVSLGKARNYDWMHIQAARIG